MVKTGVETRLFLCDHSSSTKCIIAITISYSNVNITTTVIDALMQQHSSEVAIEMESISFRSPNFRKDSCNFAIFMADECKTKEIQVSHKKYNSIQTDRFVTEPKQFTNSAKKKRGRGKGGRRRL